MVHVTVSTLIFSLVASTAVLAAPRSSRSHPRRFDEYSVLEERATLPRRWTRSTVTGPLRRRMEAKESFNLPLRINLAQSNVDKAHDILMDISHPESPRYSDHLSPHEVASLFAPVPEAVDDVLAWLADAGIDASRGNYDEFKGAITVKVPLDMVEELLHTTYELFEHEPSGTPFVGCTSYSVPKSIKHHVDFITPTIHFDVAVAQKAKRGGRTGHKKPGEGSDINPTFAEDLSALASVDTNGTTTCDSVITPACLRALYGINYTPSKILPDAYGIVEYTPQSYLPSDLDQFFGIFAPSLVGARPLNRSVDGGVLVIDKADQNPNIQGESDLDLEYAMALVQPQTVNLYQVGDTVVGGSFNTFLDALDGAYCTTEDHSAGSQDPAYPDAKDGGYKGNSCGVYSKALPKVVSTSYGSSEFENGATYAKRQCAEYMKLGLLGTTFVWASGDSGVALGDNECLGDGSVFNPVFPASCPYITSVGATEVYPGKTVRDPEGASNKVIFSGGGFSNFFSMSTYQSGAIAHYYEKHNPPYTAAQYNNSRNARGYPDMAANGVNYAVIVDGNRTLIFGTSASAPVVGSIFTLINSARAALGKKSIGFVNPALYAHPGMFNDILFGNNPGCNTTGFKAERGWDPVTGLGTPKFQTMMKVFTGLR